MEKKNKQIFTPIKYYGGKSLLLPEILPIINAVKCRTFVSLFTGGGAVEIAKNPHPVEMINDINHGMTNFYEVCSKHHTCKMLAKKLRATCYSEKVYHKAKVYYKHYSKKYPTTLKESVRFAWAVYYMCNGTYAAGILKGFAFASQSNHARTFYRRIASFNPNALVERLRHITIFNRDAVKLYHMTNKTDTLFYADPPYFNSDCGHYAGYSLKDFTDLLDGFTKCKGYFVLSCYDSDIINEYIINYSWFVKKMDMHLNVRTPNKTRKTECIVANYDFMNLNQYNLFNAEKI